MSRGQVALITGATSGIGYATALAFARAGIHVAAVGRRIERLTELEQTAASLEPGHGAILGIVGDVTRAEDMTRAVAETLARFGRLDILVANAGVGHRGAIADSDWRHLETLLRTNIDGVLHSVRAAVPAMRQTGVGHIFTISSVTQAMVVPYAAAYAASKAFVSSLSASLRLELEGEKIFVTDVFVGRTATEFNDRRLGEGKRTGQGVPTMRPERVAEAMLRALDRAPRSVAIRLFDRLLMWAGRLLPDAIGRLALRQYR